MEHILFLLHTHKYSFFAFSFLFTYILIKLLFYQNCLLDFFLNGIQGCIDHMNIMNYKPYNFNNSIVINKKKYWSWDRILML